METNLTLYSNIWTKTRRSYISFNVFIRYKINLIKRWSVFIKVNVHLCKSKKNYWNPLIVTRDINRCEGTFEGPSIYQTIQYIQIVRKKASQCIGSLLCLWLNCINVVQSRLQLCPVYNQFFVKYRIRYVIDNAWIWGHYGS